MEKFDMLDLLVKEHYGLITPKEQEKLDDLLEHSEEARELRKLVRSRPKSDADSLLKKLDPEAEAARTWKVYANRRAAKSSSSLLRWALPAVVVAVACLAGFSWWKHTRTVIDPPVVEQLPPADSEENSGLRKGITLELADGKLYPLRDSGLQTFFPPGTRLESNNGTLHIGPSTDTAFHTLTVPPEFTYAVILPDSSVISLNSGSRLRFPLAFGRTREIFIEGEAYCRIAPDAQRPFIAHALKSDIHVLGTEFNVNTYRKGIAVTSLLTGKLLVRSGIQRIVLQPGMEVVQNDYGLQQQRFDEKVTMSWRDGVHVFKGATMADIAAVIKRYYNVDVIMDSKEAGRRGNFGLTLDTHKKLHEFVEVLNVWGTVELYWKGEKLHCRAI